MRHVEVAIIGAGFGGLGAAIQLRRHGFTDLRIFEKSDDLGGTWRDNSYPGCACDVPSHLYSFSFALNPNWSDTFSGQDEIWQYLRYCAHRFGVFDDIAFGHDVSAASWDDDACVWRITTSRGEYTSRFLVAAPGPLSEPKLPDIDGLHTFDGSVFHSARWRHDLDLTGRQVAVIGTGASAAQFVPKIQPQVARLTLFQRTPAWVLTRRTRPVTKVEHAVYRHLPGAQRLARSAIYWGREAWVIGFLHPKVNKVGQRFSERMLRRQVSDDDLRDRLRPDYLMGCKRIVLSNDYWPALAKSNVDVVTDKIQRIEPDAIVTTDGERHPADVIIAGTGFHVTDPPSMRMLRGRDGQALSEAWTPTMRAHLGTMVHGFPNMFVLLGPNTGLGHNSVVLMIESQLKQMIKVMRQARRTGASTIEPTEQAQHAFNAKIDKAMHGTVWTSGGCASWYLDDTGRNSTLWPGPATSFRLRLSRFRTDDYVTDYGLQGQR